VKKRDKEAKKALTTNELQSELTRIDKEMLKIRFEKSFGAPKNPLLTRSLRREKARALTWIKMKTAASGGSNAS